ncbi:MAG: MBL fold metallo-hydrolase [Chitinophagaceae bacterium]|nr:MBL fold metallo-hydrolase [Chitinophagaceae bacterium]
MKITLWGVRGSIPTSGPDTRHYGGNTPCIEVSEDGWTLILDAGSGMQRLNSSIKLENKRVDILLTHLHFDHIQGLGFFKALFNPEMEVHIWGPASTLTSLRSRLGKYFSPPLFPVHFRDLPCKLHLHEVENSTFTIGPFVINSRYVTHLGPTIGFRISDKHAVLSYIPDHEPALGPKGLSKDLKWLSGSDLALNSDLLLHDGQFSSEEYKNKVGWGHCSMEDATAFAALAGVKHLMLFHHDPSHTDQQLDKLFRDINHIKGGKMKLDLAVEGTEINLPKVVK